MKELEQKNPDKLEKVTQVSIEKQTKFIGSSKPMPGHTTFEVNYELKTIEKAIFDNPETIKFEDAKQLIKKKVPKKITVKKNCVYISALNKKNAIKIAKRDFGINF
jgi:hypothetical protein